MAIILPVSSRGEYELSGRICDEHMWMFRQREAEASIAAATASTSGCRSAVSSAMAAANAAFTSSYASAAAAHAIANGLIAYLTHRRQKTKGKGASGKHHSTRHISGTAASSNYGQCRWVAMNEPRPLRYSYLGNITPRTSLYCSIYTARCGVGGLLPRHRWLLFNFNIEIFTLACLVERLINTCFLL